MEFIDLKSQYQLLKTGINARIAAVLDHGRYIMGPEVQELETRLQERTGAKHCITVASGTEALLISLMALDIGPGDEVITTPFTFAATDAAQSFGATYRGRSSGNLSTFGCTSFFPSKPLGCYGDGGAIFTNHDALAKASREIRIHGQSKRYVHTRLGVGGRMDTLQCAIVLAKLEQFDWELERRRAIGERYQVAFRGIRDIELLRVRDDRDCVWAQYTIFCAEREALLRHLASRNIPTAIHYPVPLDRQPAYSACPVPGGTQNSSYAASRVMSLPMSPYITEQEQDAVIEAVTSFFDERRS